MWLIKFEVSKFIKSMLLMGHYLNRFIMKKLTKLMDEHINEFDSICIDIKILG